MIFLENINNTKLHTLQYFYRKEAKKEAKMIKTLT